MWGVKVQRNDFGPYAIQVTIQWKLILTFLAVVITLIILAAALGYETYTLWTLFKEST